MMVAKTIMMTTHDHTRELLFSLWGNPSEPLPHTPAYSCGSSTQQSSFDQRQGDSGTASACRDWGRRGGEWGEFRKEEQGWSVKVVTVMAVPLQWQRQVRKWSRYINEDDEDNKIIFRTLTATSITSQKSTMTECYRGWPTITMKLNPVLPTVPLVSYVRRCAEHSDRGKASIDIFVFSLRFLPSQCAPFFFSKPSSPLCTLSLALASGCGWSKTLNDTAMFWATLPHPAQWRASGCRKCKRKRQ